MEEYEVKEKINVNQLKVGMYVSELDKPWLSSPFIFQGFVIGSEEVRQQLVDYCEFVYINIQKSDGTVVSKKHICDQRMAADAKGNVATNKIRKYQTDIEDELVAARDIDCAARECAARVFKDARMGKSINVREVSKVVRQIVDSITRNPDAMMLLSTVKDRDEYSVVHAFNVSAMSIIFGRYLNMGRRALEELGMGALLHDIGETRVPQDLLKKKGFLSDEELKLVQSHTSHGVDILRNTEGLPECAVDITYSHHERCNGSGYPLGISTADISLFSKIVSIVDVYDSVTTACAHKGALSSTDALKTMYDWRDSLFDGELVEHFIQCLGIYPVGSVVELNTGEVGIVFSVPPDSRLLPKIMLVRDANKVPYMPPRIIQLAQYKDDEQSAQYEITKVLGPDAYGIDFKQYLLRELQMEKMTA